MPDHPTFNDLVERTGGAMRVGADARDLVERALAGRGNTWIGTLDRRREHA